MSDWRFQNERSARKESWVTGGSSDIESFGGQPTAAEVSLGERLGFIRKVYALFFIATLFAVGGVGLGFAFPEFVFSIFARPLIAILVLFGGVFLAQAVRHVRGLNLLALFGFTTLTGLVISPAIIYYSVTNPGSILQAGVLTVAIFGGLTAYVFVTKRDFSFLRGLLFTGLIMVLVGGLLNIFIIGSSAMGFAIAAMALLLFSGYVLYDTSNIIRRYPTNEYVAGALSLYLDAFNIFLALLRLLNAGRR